MKLYLFGGAEISLGQFEPQLKLIEMEILKIMPRQILHIPFARTQVAESEKNYWGEGWFQKMERLNRIEYLNAAKEDDIGKAKNPLVFISGGNEHTNLLNSILENQKLSELIMNSEFYFGESAGAMIAGQCMREIGMQKSRLIKALSILPDTIIEPHYRERKRHQLLITEMEECKVKIGLGIDCATAVIIDTDKFPREIIKVGQGNIDLIK